MKTKLLLIIIVVFVTHFIVLSQYNTDFNTTIMRATYKIEGQNGLVGSAFIVGQRMKLDSTRGYYILVTAKHVLDDMQGDSAILYVRFKQNDEYIKVPYKFSIRNKGVNLYTSHTTEDVAAMYISFPPNADIEICLTDLFINDAGLKEINIHPGDEVFILGYPLDCESNDAGFPILRSGRIASYPIIPTKVYKTFLVDFQVFKGNSGGPVYFTQSNRLVGGTMKFGQMYNFFIGLVSGETVVKERSKSMEEDRVISHKLSLATIVPASYILETINLLPKRN